MSPINQLAASTLSTRFRLRSARKHAEVARPTAEGSPRTIGAMMGLSWQQGPLGRNPNGTFVSATPMPKRVLYLEPLRRRMSVELGRSVVGRSDDVVLLFDPARYPVAYFPVGDIAEGALHPIDRRTTHADLCGIQLVEHATSAQTRA
jgi:hypothetical protein